MHYIVFDLNENDQSVLNQNDLKIIADIFSKELPIEGSFLVEINIISEEESRQLNKKYRQKDHATDVLTFPNLELISDNVPPHTTNQPLLLGSINICTEIAIKRGELPVDLVHHGLLHLLGYDHEIDESTWKNIEKDVILKLRQRDLSITSLYDYN